MILTAWGWLRFGTVVISTCTTCSIGLKSSLWSKTRYRGASLRVVERFSMVSTDTAICSFLVYLVEIVCKRDRLTVIYLFYLIQTQINAHEKLLLLRFDNCIYFSSTLIIHTVRSIFPGYHTFYALKMKKAAIQSLPQPFSPNYGH